MPNTSQCWKNQRDRRYEGCIKPVRTLYSAHSRTIESFISLFLSPPSPFQPGCSCFQDYLRAYLTDVLFSSLRIELLFACRMVTYRYPIFDTGHRVSPRINYKLSPSTFLFVGKYPRFNYLRGNFRFIQATARQQRALRERVTCPSVECNPATKTYRTYTRCRKIYGRK